MSKIRELNKKIEETVVNAYQKVEDTVTGGYQKVEDAVTGTYQKVEDKFVERFLTEAGETVEQAKSRLKGQEESK